MRGRTPAGALIGTVEVPGDKSISHRALILAALARGPSTIEHLGGGDDVAATVAALAALGVPIAFARTEYKAQVEGLGLRGLREPGDVIDAGNSGTTLRLGAGVLAGVNGASVITGDESVRRRPMLRVVAPLRQMGARIDGRNHGENAPLHIRGGDLTGIDIEIPVASAQVKGALLLAGLVAEGETTVSEPAASRDHTERMLAAAGVGIRRQGAAVSVAGGSEPAPIDRRVPGDLSSALFLIVAATLVPGSDLTVERVGLNPTRTAALDVLNGMGADIEVEVEGEDGGEPYGRVRARHSDLRAVDIAPSQVPALIDELPILAVAATQAEGTTTVTGAGELRVKESDRIQALATGLPRVGGRGR